MASLNETYGAFLDYFGDIPLQKIKDNNGFDIYCCRVSSGLRDNRYVYVVCNSTKNPETTTLNSLDWVSIQTRTTEDNHIVPKIDLLLNEDRKNALSDQLTLVSRNSTKTEYSTTELPIKINLMHNLKKNNSYQYPDSCKLYQALQTYQCVIELI